MLGLQKILFVSCLSMLHESTKMAPTFFLLSSNKNYYCFYPFLKDIFVSIKHYKLNFCPTYPDKQQTNNYLNSAFLYTYYRLIHWYEDNSKFIVLLDTNYWPWWSQIYCSPGHKLLPKAKLRAIFCLEGNIKLAIMWISGQ